MENYLIPLLEVIGGLVILVLGGEGLVRGAVGLANRLGVPVLIIGLTIVSFGTSAPELVISLQSVLSGYPDIALGNIIGSNIANILMVLGTAAIIFPIAVDPKLIKRDAPLMLFVSVLLILFCYGGMITRMEAGVFLAIIIAYTIYIFRSAKSGKEDDLMEELEEETDIDMSTLKAIIYLMGGIALLIFGSGVLIDGSVTLARALGVSEGLIGLTVLAIGSSAPELVTAVVASYRRQADIAIGNIVGSNLFNITVIGGTAATVVPMSVADQYLASDLWIMLIVTLILILFMVMGKTIHRWQGVLLLVGYFGYTFWLIYQAGMLTA